MVVVVNCGVGNLGSILNMLQKVSKETVVSSKKEIVASARKLILPGVGSFDQGMSQLSASGLLPILEEKVMREKTPIIGLCLGLQLLTNSSQEGNAKGLGWLDAETVRFKASEKRKVPQMQWNFISVKKKHSLVHGLGDDAKFYFANSYHVVCQSQDDVVATTFYGSEFASIVARDNISGVQFHPEKSHRFGRQLLANFVNHV